MKILLLCNPHFQNAFQRLGHEVIWVGGAEAEFCDVRKYKADIVILHETLGNRHIPNGIAESPVPTVFYSVDVHLNFYWHREFAQLFDYVFVSQKDYVGLMNHDNAHWLPWSINPEVFYDHTLPRIHDIVFVGTVDSARRKRKNILECLGKKYSIKTAGHDPRKRLSHRETARLYSQARIILNESIHHEVNFRVFEALACGGLLLSERVENGLADLFRDGRELVLFDENNLIETVAAYLNNEARREEIAARGSRVVHERHTVNVRALELLQVLETTGWRKKERPRERWALACGKALFFTGARFPQWRSRRYKRSELYLRAAYQRETTRIEVGLFLGFLYFCTRNNTQLSLLLEDFLKNPGTVLDAVAAARLCCLLKACGADEAATRLLEMIATHDETQKHDFYMTVGNVYEQAGLIHEPGWISMPQIPLTALDCYARSTLLTESSEGICAAGKILFRTGCYDGACDCLEAALKTDPENKSAEQLLAKAYRKAYVPDPEHAAHEYCSRARNEHRQSTAIPHPKSARGPA